MERRKRVVKTLIIIIAMYIIGCNMWNGKDTSQIDVVSSICMGSQEKLIVVANCNRIKDKSAFAIEVLQRYIDNSFPSIKLSTDLGEEVSYLQVNVYLKEKQIKQGNLYMEITYEVQDISLEKDIRKNPELVDIYIDGKKQSIG